ncbi:MAG: NUMOD3 domain-containing DNA-binding protein [Proteobacteria bacterium]|jgi:hypothetical protein|nr:NUMOD3 domain-containing DNA-binding protein [Pseudomonadota bacterium]
MNIEQFKELYKNLRDVDSINVDDLCDCPNHIKAGKPISKGPARKNILKHGGREFVCRACDMVYNNPMNRIGENRQTNEEIMVYCPCVEHVGDNGRLMKKSCYYGEMIEPYIQMCKSCAQRGKIITEEQKEKIKFALKGIKRSDEFKEKLSQYMKNNPEGIARATRNLLENQCTTGMLGKHHSEETKQQMSQSHCGKTFTEEHCQNISDGRKKMLAETGGFSPEHRRKLSEATIRLYKQGFNPKTHHVRGWHESPKAGKIFFSSSYEKKAFLKLDEDLNVKTYYKEKIKISYYNPVKNFEANYLVDLEIQYIDDSIKWIEVKPAAWLDDEVIVAKHKAAQIIAEKSGVLFDVWCEVDLFGAVYNPKHIELFVEKLRQSLGICINHKELNNKKSKKHYHKNIIADTIDVFCPYCQITHTALRLTYDKNIARNGRYICEKEGGHIAGSKPKKKKVNPYAVEGKKQCNQCREVKLFEEFGIDKLKSDGYATRCKKCRCKSANEKYNHG